MKIKLLICTIVASIIVVPLMADEGLWLPNRAGELYKQMRRLGIKVSLEQIWSVGERSVGGAVVSIDGGRAAGCVISSDGLVITTHSDAMKDLEYLSIDNPKLASDGFVARNRFDELPVKSSVTFVRGIEDVTAEANELKEAMVADGLRRGAGDERLIEELRRRHQADNDFDVVVEQLWGGSEYMLYYTQTFTDVRVVAVPPWQLAQVGGAAQTGEWPEHRCDFVVYRIYADGVSCPAAYSSANVPLQTTANLIISNNGVSEGDATLSFGFPRFDRYCSSQSANVENSVVDPIVARASQRALDVIDEQSTGNGDYPDQYIYRARRMAVEYKSTKDRIGAMRRWGVVATMEQNEQKIADRVLNTDTLQSHYGELFADLDRSYRSEQGRVSNATVVEAVKQTGGIGINAVFALAAAVARMERIGIETVVSAEDMQIEVPRSLVSKYDRYDEQTEQKLARAAIVFYFENTDRALWSDRVIELFDKCNANPDSVARLVCESSFCSSRKAFEEFFAQPRTTEQISSDPLVALVTEIGKSVGSTATNTPDNRSMLENDYRKVQYQLGNNTVRSYPDSDGQLRFGFGRVCGARIDDAVSYLFRSSIEGVAEQLGRTNYVTRQTMRSEEAIAQRDWGKWGEKATKGSSAQLYVGFMVDNDFADGCQGGPITDSRGRITGIMLGGVCRSAASGYYYNSTTSRVAVLDIRYALWCLDKVLGADFLIDEMRIERDK